MKLLWFAAGLGLMLQSGAPAQTRTVPIGIRYSTYSVTHLDVRVGTVVRFELRNDDPIAHEFIVGTPAEQQAHEAGLAPSHDGLPGQASLDIGERTVVTWTFDRPGTMEFACHLPGHFKYGMKGTVKVSS